MSLNVAKIVPLRRTGLARRDELEFLPAALEVLETPPSPVGRAIGATILLFALLAAVWATFSNVDIIATASGKIVPTGRTKVIQPFETGVVRAIRVQDGQVVKTGDVLLELDSTISTAERDRLAKELVAMQLDVARLRAVLAGATDPNTKFIPPPKATTAQIETQRVFFQNQLDEFRAKIGSIDRQIAQNEANRAAVSAAVDKLKRTLPLLQQRLDARKYLSDNGYGSRLTYLEIQQDYVEHEEELRVQEARLAQAISGTDALQEQRRQTEAEFRRTNLAELTQAEQKASSLLENLVQAEQRTQLQTLTAPVDGTIQQLAIHTVGGVVTPAQQLMAVVPTDSHLEVESMISNRDIGFVRVGQEAEVKIDTFNFTRYGLIRGTVTSVSQDAIVREKPAGQAASGALANSSEPQGQELQYAARVVLDTTQMQIDDRVVTLSPGMAVTVEIKTGSRRLIEYIFSPLLRYKQESLRER
ncbi:MAG TPA: HlyD family type I secretion periplasmic adaptor subunit [Xanthobacteraceae bacterium]|jgi:hemolysin D|nr:HlyD family type I secretion periplasmic adaptor subunit [Xanthobacteraceae bacterium]